jgi:hypothetical protein
MDAATTIAMKELKRVIQFVLTTKDLGLRIEPKFVNNKWKMTVYTDSNWAGDKDTRHSVTGLRYIFVKCSNILEC